MTIFLTSSPTGPLDNSRPVNGVDHKNRFIENLRQHWKWGMRCLMISAAPADDDFNDSVQSSMWESFHRGSFPITVFDTWDDRTDDFSQETLHSYDVILLGGGHVPTQSEFFERIELKKKLKGYSGVIIGISAGTMNCAEEVYAFPEKEGESIDPDYKRFIPGLGLTHVNVCPHYQMVKDWILDGVRLYEDIAYPDSKGREFLVIPDGSYVVVEDGVHTLWGEGYRLADGVLTPVCKENETLVLGKKTLLKD